MQGGPVDLTACDAEPIHVIGAIQPDGALVAADAQTWTVAFASANTSSYLGRDCADILGLPLRDLLGEKAFAALAARPLEPTCPDIVRPVFVDLPRLEGEPIALECFAHLHDGRVVLEFVPRAKAPAALWEEDLVRQRVISSLVQPESLSDLARVGAQIVREVTGFDRVMVYRFAPDRHGEVIGESTGRPDSFLGLHYPASDIPDPARRHFALNVIRTIPDVHAVPVPILARSAGGPRSGSARPLDLTFSKLRAVAPVHVEYLANMGVAASLSISLIANGELWGLVACHHYRPLHLSWSALRFCELLGGTISALLQSLENTVQLRHSIRAEKLAFVIEHEARRGGALAEVVEAHAGALMEELSADGIVLRLGGRLVRMGRVPSGELGEDALRSLLVDGIATSDQLSRLLCAEGSGDIFAGAAMMELSDDGKDWMILFRREHEHEIRWAGKPDKREIPLPGGAVRLSPRGSFALWREERRGRSRPFTATDDEVLRITRRALFAINSLDRERAAVAARLLSETEETRLRLVLLDSARTRSMGELASALAHELNQPLSAVTNYVNACRQELRNFGQPLPAGVGTLMDSALSEAARAADLVRRLRNLISQGEVALELSNLHQVVRQGVGLALAAGNDAAPQVVFEFEADLPDIWIDPVQIAQVVLNLARNSLAAMRGSDVRRLTIATRREAGIVEVAVTDTGSGIAPSMRKSLFEPFHSSTTRGMGIGLSLCRSIVEAHGGRIWTRPISGGTQFVFTMEARDGRDE